MGDNLHQRIRELARELYGIDFEEQLDSPPKPLPAIPEAPDTTSHLPGIKPDDRRGPAA
jgi:hypothetical protein